MSYLLITTVVLFLYLRTYRYYNKIDDHEPRASMYVQVPPRRVTVDEDGVRFDDKRMTWLAVFTNIGTYILVCWLINYMFGWKVALLYAVMPTNVSGVAWSTGNYYMSTCFLILTAYYFLTTFTWGIVPALVFYYAGLESTISALPLLVIGLTLPNGWILTVPLVKFLTSKRFIEGLKKRKKSHEEVGMMSAKISWKNPILVIEVMVYYILLGTGFMPLGFFHDFGRRGELWLINMYFFLSLALLVLFCYFGYLYSPFGLFWWLMFMGLFCQAIPNLGQFVTERYMYIANIGYCMILCSFFEQLHIMQGFWFLVGVWLMITYNYIPAWRNNMTLFSHGIVAFPECPDHYVNLSSYYMEHDDYGRAIRPLQKAIEYTLGAKYKLFGNLGKCFLAFGEKKKAIAAFKCALVDADPTQIEPLNKIISNLERSIKC